MNKRNRLGLVFLVAICVQPVISLLACLLPEAVTEHLPWFVPSLIAEAGFAIPTLIYFSKEEGKLTELIRLKPIKMSTFFKTILLAFTVTPIYITVNLLSQLVVPNTVAQASENMFVNGPVNPLLMTVVCAPVCEELAFRGLFAGQYKEISSGRVALFLSALLFGLAHLNVNQLCYAFVLGLVFVLLNEASGSIVTSVMLHAIINFVGISATYISSLAAQNAGTNLADSAEAVRKDSGIMLAAIAFYAVLAVIGALLSRLLIRSIAKKEENFEAYSAFLQKREDSGKAVSVFLIIGIVVSVLMIFGWAAVKSIIGA